MLTSNVAEAGGFGYSRDGLSRPDLQWIFAPVQFEAHGAVDPTVPHADVRVSTCSRPESPRSGDAGLGRAVPGRR